MERENSPPSTVTRVIATCFVALVCWLVAYWLSTIFLLSPVETVLIAVLLGAVYVLMSVLARNRRKGSLESAAPRVRLSPRESRLVAFSCLAVFGALLSGVPASEALATNVHAHDLLHAHVAEVVTTENCGSGPKSPYVCSWTYRVRGKTYTYTPYFGINENEYEDGKRVTLYYWPVNPTVASPESLIPTTISLTRSQTDIFGGIFAGFVLLSIVVISWYRHVRKRASPRTVSGSLTS